MRSRAIWDGAPSRRYLVRGRPPCRCRDPASGGPSSSLPTVTQSALVSRCLGLPGRSRRAWRGSDRRTPARAPRETRRPSWGCRRKARLSILTMAWTSPCGYAAPGAVRCRIARRKSTMQSAGSEWTNSAALSLPTPRTSRCFDVSSARPEHGCSTGECEPRQSSVRFLPCCTYSAVRITVAGY